ERGGGTATAAAGPYTLSLHDALPISAAREMIRTRASVVKSLRRTLDERGFLELETPMLQIQPGGAAARPFVTHMNAYDVDLYLRSEEHTSELQSREKLVCRLLLEKKK